MCTCTSSLNHKHQKNDTHPITTNINPYVYMHIHTYLSISQKAFFAERERKRAFTYEQQIEAAYYDGVDKNVKCVRRIYICI